MKTNEASLGKMETQLKRWGAKLDQLVARADTASADARIDHRKRIAALRTQHKQACAKLEELKAASSAEWDTLKQGVDATWTELEVAFEKLTN